MFSVLAAYLADLRNGCKMEGEKGSMGVLGREVLEEGGNIIRGSLGAGGEERCLVKRKWRCFWALGGLLTVMCFCRSTGSKRRFRASIGKICLLVVFLQI